jgi:DNA topoisomerase-3
LTVAVIAEKPSVARSIAEVLGAHRRGAGLCRGNGYAVTWAVGHLVGLAEPHEMDPRWKAWRPERLPMLPGEWRLAVLEQTKEQYAIVEALLRSAEVDRVVCATDAGREGELIFRYIMRMAGCRKPVERLWISSLTPEAIRAGFERLRPGEELDALAAAAEARSRADWLVGMNFTRAYTLRFGPELLSVGRVQTPTLAMIVDRERAIRDFVPEKYRQVIATFGEGRDGYAGVWFDPAKTRSDGEELAQRLPADGALAEAIRARCEGGSGRIVEASGADRSIPPPLLYDLTELQRHANRLYGMTAQATLGAAQALYEQHKLLSYPRTDSRHLSAAVASSLRPIVGAVSPAYGDAVAPGTGEAPLSRRFVDDARVTDHHAIIPTGVSREGVALGADEERVYDLVCRRLLMAWHADHRTRVTKVVTRVPAEAAPGPEPRTDLFRSTGTVVTQRGWKALDVEPRRRRVEDGGEGAAPRLPEGLAAGQERPVTAVEVKDGQTSPPRRFTDASLLTAMESAGRALDSRELEEAMRERGLGTPATRAAILETLLTRGYVERQGKALAATGKGIALVDVVHPSVKSPQLTGEWELALKRLERGEGSLQEILAGIERFVVEVVEGLRSATARPSEGAEASGEGAPETGPASATSARTAGPEGAGPGAANGSNPPGRQGSRARTAADAEALRGDAPGPGRAPPARDLPAILKERFGHQVFRANQEEVCRSVTSGEDALLVMPTGSGKSLCYQLPGVARGGTTLVVSPLIALMEDQTAKLREKGFRAERIHSGRSREQSRAACRAYLDGALDFLAIAPERLSVPGFPEMLARRSPTLIAVDEAHCISHWGHDFRPDYRLLGGRLPLLRPSPIVALTATATVRVQDDILAQLGIRAARRFIRGFRRENLAIEAVERPRAERVALALAALGPEERRPALVYVPSRRAAEEVARSLAAAGFRAAPYHAGLEASVRSRTQDAFQRGEIEVVVATIAFGMGIDKADIRTVVHLALPGTVEGYYQEIGRAGRDGLPARALLCYSWSDRKMHESFLERDYPETSLLERLLERVPEAGIERPALLATCGLDAESAEPALGKLWVHGGVAIDGDDIVRRGKVGWQPRYEAIRTHRRGQLDEVLDFAQSGGCRMVRLVRHFGEARDTRPCGACDDCLPRGCVARRFREASEAELSLAARVVEALEPRDGIASGALMRSLFPSGGAERRDLERTLDALARAGAVSLQDDAFEKDGRSIRFRRVHLGPDPRGALRRDRLLFDGDDARPEAAQGSRRKRPRRAERGPAPSVGRPPAPGREEPARPPDPALEERLREWRRALARARGVPAFVILTDRTLQAIASAKPASLAELLEVRGAGPKLAEKHGAAILQLVKGGPGS